MYLHEKAKQKQEDDYCYTQDSGYLEGGQDYVGKLVGKVFFLVWVVVID